MQHTPEQSQRYSRQPAREGGGGREPFAAALAAAGLFYCMALPLILSECLMGRSAFDQLHFHEPVIRQFAAQWPGLELADYRSATTPGYHVLLALVWRYVAASGMALQLAGSAISALLIGLFAYAAAVGGTACDPAGGERVRPPWWRGVLLTLPLLASMYVFFPGVWLLPDNLGWLLVLGVALVAWCLTNGRGSRAANLAIGAALLLALVLVRQSHLWAAVLLWLGAWIGAAPLGDGGLAAMTSRTGARGRALGLALLATLPAVVAFAVFIWMWRGLTPPSFVRQYGSVINLATPAFVLALLGLVSCFFAGYIAPAAWRLARERPVGLLLAMALAALVAVLPETTYAVEQRSSGLWNLVKIGPLIAGHTSVVLLVLAPAGAWALWAWFVALGPAARWLFLGAIVAFTAAQTTNPLCWQRYIEPLLLMMMGLGAATIPPPVYTGRERGIALLLKHLAPPMRLAGPVALAVVLGLITARSLLTAEVPWNTEIGPSGRRRVIEGGFTSPGRVGETVPEAPAEGARP